MIIIIMKYIFIFMPFVSFTIRHSLFLHVSAFVFVECFSTVLLLLWFLLRCYYIVLFIICRSYIIWWCHIVWRLFLMKANFMKEKKQNKKAKTFSIIILIWKIYSDLVNKYICFDWSNAILQFSVDVCFRERAEIWAWRCKGGKHTRTHTTQ